MSGWALSAIMFVAGIGIPVMAALNSGLGMRLGHPVLAAAILFALALVTTGAAWVSQPTPPVVPLLTIPFYLYLGGLFVAFYVLSVTWIAPKLGVGNAIVLVLLGQLVASALIDHYGWFGAPQAALTSARFTGMAMMAIGVLLARKPI